MKHFFFSLIILCSAHSIYAQGTLEIHHLYKDFYIFTTYRNYQGTPFPSNGMYVLSSEGALIIDSPWDTTQFQPLLDSIWVKHHQKPVLMLATHAHEDRTAAINYYNQLGIQTYTSRLTDSLCNIQHAPRAIHTFIQDTVFILGQHRMEIRFPGEGHSSDNAVVWFEKERILYGGCLIKSTEATHLGNLSDANLLAWPQTIKKLQQLYPKPNFIIPGHQGWSNVHSLEHTLLLLQQHQKPKH